MMEQIAEASPCFKARIAGVFYLLTFLTGGVALFVRGRLGFAAGLIAGACYIAVTLLFYHIFKPVNRRLSLLSRRPSAWWESPLDLLVSFFSRSPTSTPWYFSDSI